MKTITVFPTTPGEQIAEQLGLRADRPLVILMGGASNMSEEAKTRLHNTIAEGLAKAIKALGAAVIDGGTDSGVMGMLNAGLAAVGFEGPYIGVATAGKVQLPNQAEREDAYHLGIHHTHGVLVHGDDWGDELPAMSALFGTLAKGQPSLGVLANGGGGARNEVLENVRQRREVLLLRGSGRLADDLINVVENAQAEVDENIRQLATLGRFSIYDMRNPPRALTQMVINKLQPEMGG